MLYYLVKVQNYFSVFRFNSFYIGKSSNTFQVCFKSRWNSKFLNCHPTGTSVKPSEKETVQYCYECLLLFILNFRGPWARSSDKKVVLLSYFSQRIRLDITFKQAQFECYVNKRQKDCVWKQRTHYRLENVSLGFIFRDK